MIKGSKLFRELFQSCRSIFAAVICVYASTAAADLRLGSPISDHMVVQRHQPVTLWGWDRPGQIVQVELAEAEVETVTGENGRWEVAIDAPPTGGPYELIVRGSQTKRLTDVLSGEVWLASGQSNMGFPVYKTEGAAETIAQARHPDIRFFKVPAVSEAKPQGTVEGSWTVVSPETAGNLSGVAYFFAKRLQKELDCPVGILEAAWGGSKIQAWIPIDIMRSRDDYQSRVTEHREAKVRLRARMDEWEAGDRSGPKPPTGGGGRQHAVSHLDNAMMHPLQPYSIKGAIWYQGESDSGNGAMYEELFTLMVNAWRDRFDNPNLPVYFAQLPNYARGKTWATFRHHQSLIPSRLPHTDYASLIDAGDANDIHPPNKRIPGHRLAQLALAKQYGLDIVPGGPKPMTARRVGQEIHVMFENVGEGLQLSGESSAAFTLVDEIGEQTVVPPEIMGNKLVFDVPPGSSVVRITYANRANPGAVLFNQDGFPATPFRLEIQ